MNVRALIVALFVAVAFFAGWTDLRRTSSQRAPASSSPSVEVEVPTTVNPSPNRPASPPADLSKDPRTSVITDIHNRRDQKIAEIKQRAVGFETEADRREIATIQKEAEEQVKALLSDSENRSLQLEDFKRTDLGKALLEHYPASDTELAAISDHEKAIADVIASKGDLEGVQARSLERLEKILGTERLNEFMNYHDPDYVEALNFTKRFSLPPETAMELMKLRNEHGKLVVEGFKQGKPGNGLSAPFRPRVTELLGAGPGEIYIREAKGALWLR